MYFRTIRISEDVILTKRFISVALRDKLREQSLQSTTISLDLLERKKDNFEQTLYAQYNELAQKLKQSQKMIEQ